jgi:hypothetical protein
MSISQTHGFLISAATIGRSGWSSRPLSARTIRGSIGPPRAGEQHAYARARVHLAGEITWLAGPFPRRAPDAFGEVDYGDASGWEVTGNDHRLVGDWGSVVVTDAAVDVAWDSVE